MQRLTARDWQIINEALALFEASTGDLYLSEEEQAEVDEQVGRTRAKVAERLPT